MTTNIDNEELSAFIGSTLRAIKIGIDSAGIEVGHGPIGKDAFRMPKQVVFDVAVTIKQTDEASAGLKVQICGFGAGADGRIGSESQTVSRISFDVPWAYESWAQRLAGPRISESIGNND
jgi:hypothetical protein